MSSENKINLKVETFYVKDNKTDSVKHRHAHLETLKSWGLENLFLSAKIDWTSDIDTIAVNIIEKKSNEILGGARIINSRSIIEFPLYEMITAKDTHVNDFLKSKINRSNAEVIGVWLSKKATNMSLTSKFILRTIFSSMKHFNLECVFGLSSMAIWDSLNELGSKPVLEFGKNGLLKYTSKKIPAKVYYFNSPEYIELANKKDRIILLELTNSKHATLHEKIGENQFSVEYKFIV